MKTFSKLTAAVLSASLALAAAAPVNNALTTLIPTAAAADTASENLPSFTSDEEMLNYIRTQMQLRNEEIKVLMPNATEDEMSRYSGMTIRELFDPTGRVTEGKYLYLSLYQNSSWVHYTEQGLVIELSTKYITTEDQEDDLSATINSVKRLLGSEEIERLKALPVKERIEYVYEKFVPYLKNITIVDEDDPKELGSAYSALVKRKANEKGIIQLFVRALAELDIDSELYYTNYDSDTPLTAHYLAAVPIDGSYYLLDPVWDYKSGSKNGEYKFFLKGMEDIDSDVSAGSEFTHEHLTIFGISIMDIAAANGFSMYSYDKKFDMGDVNGNGTIDAVDASSVLAEYARNASSDTKGIFSAGQKAAADVNASGNADAVDASLILSYYAYVSTTQSPKSIEDFVKQ